MCVCLCARVCVMGLFVLCGVVMGCLFRALCYEAVYFAIVVGCLCVYACVGVHFYRKRWWEGGPVGDRLSVLWVVG